MSHSIFYVYTIQNYAAKAPQPPPAQLLNYSTTLTQRGFKNHYYNIVQGKDTMEIKLCLYNGGIYLY